MWNKILLALTMAITVPTSCAYAEVGGGGQRPAFTSQDRIIIQRNAALRELVDHDPWLVRRVLDAIANAPGEDRSAQPPASREATRESVPDPVRNPDLDKLGRSSPEAAHDLFQLIKKAVKK